MKNNEKALQPFMAKIATATELLEELKNFVDDHMGYSPDEINFGHCGNAGYLVEKLTELSDWAFQRGEYAR